MKVLHESLREYQEASMQWMQDHAQLERDLSRLRMQIDVSRGNAHGGVGPLTSSGHRGAFASAARGSPTTSLLPASPLEALASTPRRAQSPTASTTSPYVRQPIVRAASPSDRVGRSPISAAAEKPLWRLATH